MRLQFMRYFSLFNLLIIGSLIQAQNKPGVLISPLNNNQTLKAAIQGAIYPQMAVPTNLHIERRDAGDTLTLPFFDDFTSSVIYPDMRLWMDSFVFVNNNFPISPPSYGVATFDNLDKQGNPYSGQLNANLFQAWDTLTSKPINLKTYFVGPNEFNYTLTDSIYLSFFYQGGGVGDRPETQDSLVLQFRLKNNNWRSVWNTSQIGMNPFKQVLVGVLDSNYLWEAFQFRLLYYTSALGNLNQLHIDYVRMNRNRNANDTLIRDVAINKGAWSLLKNYHAMPYTHFVADSSNQKTDKFSIGIRNNDVDIINTQFQFEAYHKSNQLALYPFSVSSRNIFATSDTSESFNIFGFGNLQQNEYVYIKNVFKINPQAGNNTPSGYNSLGNNDEYIQYQDFKNYYAYDDGTAEGGIGLNYEGLPAGRGTFAIKYNLTKADTLAGLAIFFNQSKEDVSARQFKLCVWKNLSNGSVIDEPIYEYSVLAPAYTDSINGFHYYVFDTTIVLPKGDYYVGWSQIAIFNLNVGYDNNYRLEGKEQRNSNILYNLTGVWQNVDISIKGAPMIRPLIGEYSQWALQVKNPSCKENIHNRFVVLPNPNQGFFEIRNIHQQSLNTFYSIRTIEGREIMHGEVITGNLIDMSSLASGIYVLYIQEGDNLQFEKLIKE